jgi:hypothetical protein
LCAALIGAATVPAYAGPVTFNLISSSSTLNASFDVTALGGALVATQQKAGSLTSRYTGSVATNITNLGIGGTAINFFPGQDGDATAMTGISPGIGGVLPGTAAGDYGVRLNAPLDQPIDLPAIDLSALNIPGLTSLDLGVLQSVNVDIALRDIKVDITTVGSIPMPTPIAPIGTFDASQVDLGFTGTADINASLVLKQDNIIAYFANLAALTLLDSALSGQGIDVTVTGNLIAQTISVGLPFTQAISGTLPNGAGTGTIEHVGSNYRLTLPVDFSVLDSAGIDLVLGIDARLQGQFVGTAPFTTVPEPSTWALALVGLALPVLGRRFRRAR